MAPRLSPKPPDLFKCGALKYLLKKCQPHSWPKRALRPVSIVQDRTHMLCLRDWACIQVKPFHAI